MHILHQCIECCWCKSPLRFERRCNYQFQFRDSTHFQMSMQMSPCKILPRTGFQLFGKWLDLPGWLSNKWFPPCIPLVRCSFHQHQFCSCKSSFQKSCLAYTINQNCKTFQRKLVLTSLLGTLLQCSCCFGSQCSLSMNLQLNRRMCKFP